MHKDVQKTHLCSFSARSVHLLSLLVTTLCMSENCIKLSMEILTYKISTYLPQNYFLQWFASSFP